MRPKKRVLLVDDDAQALSLRSFLLRTRGYIVLEATEASTAISIFNSGAMDVVVAALGRPEADGNELGNALICQLKEMAPGVPTILTSATVRAGERAHRADAFLGKNYCSPADLMECIRVMTRLKRGPRKAVLPAREAARA